MQKSSNFWSEAAKCGAVLGGVNVLFALLSDITPFALVGLAGFAASLWLMYRFTARRAARLATPEEGFPFGKCYGFTLGMAPFIGIIQAAYSLLASGVLFVEKYETAYQTSFALLRQLGYTDEMLASVYGMMHSPLWVTLSSILGQVFFALLFGWIIALVARRQPDIFHAA